MDENVQVAMDGNGHWVAIWTSNEKDVQVSRSGDYGITWSPVKTLMTNAISRGPYIVTGGLGTWIAAWMAHRTTGSYDIFYSRSSDHGATWSTPVPLQTNTAKDGSANVAPRITSDGQGRWIAVWHSNNPALGGGGGPFGEFDIVYVVSSDNGVNWSAPKPLNQNAFQDQGYDTYPSLATDGHGNWVVVWQTTEPAFGGGGGALSDSEIVSARSTDHGKTWSNPIIVNQDARINTGLDSNPRLATDSKGTWITVWLSDNSLVDHSESEADIHFSYSTDAGATWSAPEALNDNANTDQSDDLGPCLAVDKTGCWISAWFSMNKPDGSRGSDSDIWYATGSMDSAVNDWRCYSGPLSGSVHDQR